MATSKKSKKTGKKSSASKKPATVKTEKPAEVNTKETEEIEEVEVGKTEEVEEIEETTEETSKDKEEVEEAEVVEEKEIISSESTCKNEPETVKGNLKGFFSRKFDASENILTIFKNPRIYGAILGELLGTMLIAILMLTLGVQPLYIVFGSLGITLAVFALSGANLNPLITVGMMASRRISAIRGVLYILAQIVGAWFGMLLVNAFRLGSGTEAELPKMAEITGETFWVVALVELVGAIMIAFFFARALKYAKKSPLTFGLTITSGLTFAIIFGIVVSQSFFELQNSFIFNPAVALMYQILPTTADNFGQLLGNISLALSAYVVLPMIGGILGFYIADFAGRLAGEKCCCKDCCEKK